MINLIKGRPKLLDQLLELKKNILIAILIMAVAEAPSYKFPQFLYNAEFGGVQNLKTKNIHVFRTGYYFSVSDKGEWTQVSLKGRAYAHKRTGLRDAYGQFKQECRAKGSTQSDFLGFKDLKWYPGISEVQLEDAYLEEILSSLYCLPG